MPSFRLYPHLTDSVSKWVTFWTMYVCHPPQTTNTTKRMEPKKVPIVSPIRPVKAAGTGKVYMRLGDRPAPASAASSKFKRVHKSSNDVNLSGKVHRMGDRPTSSAASSNYKIIKTDSLGSKKNSALNPEACPAPRCLAAPAKQVIGGLGVVPGGSLAMQRLHAELCQSATQAQVHLAALKLD